MKPKELSIDELTAIVKFTLEGSFDSFNLYKKMPALASGDEPILLVEGTKGINKYRYEFRYAELHAMQQKGVLNAFLLKERDKVFKENNS